MPTIVHEACPEFAKGKPFIVQARFEDESQLYDPQVVYRLGPSSRWKQVLFAKEAGSEDFTATIEVGDLIGAIEYYVQVFDEHGNGPARMGSADAPIEVQPARDPVPCRQIPQERAVTVTESSTSPSVAGATAGLQPPPGGEADAWTAEPPPLPGRCDGEDRPLYCEAWLWVAAGGVLLASAGVATYFVAIQGGGAPADTITLRVTGPDPSVNGLGSGR
jgi:hypothetical protein